MEVSFSGARGEKKLLNILGLIHMNTNFFHLLIKMLKGLHFVAKIKQNFKTSKTENCFLASPIVYQ